MDPVRFGPHDSTGVLSCFNDKYCDDEISGISNPPTIWNCKTRRILLLSRVDCDWIDRSIFNIYNHHINCRGKREKRTKKNFTIYIVSTLLLILSVALSLIFNFVFFTNVHVQLNKRILPPDKEKFLLFTRL